MTRRPDPLDAFHSAVRRWFEVSYASQGRDAELTALLSEMTSKVPTPKSYDVALSVCRIIGDPACERGWRRRKAERFGRAAG